MNDTRHLLAATRTKPTGFASLVTQTVSLRTVHECQPTSQTNSLRYMLIVSLAFLCLPSVFNTNAFSQGQTITVGVLEFQDESGAGPRVEVARKLAQKLNSAYKDVLARQSRTATDASTIEALSVEQLGALGKQQGVKFVVRGGQVAAGDGNSTTEMDAAIQLYADVVSVETLGVKTVRAEGSNSERDQALSMAIERLAEAIHQALVSPEAEPAAPATSDHSDQGDESPRDTGGEDNPVDDSKEVEAAEADEELQQLIAQAESLVADGSGASGEGLALLSQALESLKAALKTKAALLEEGKDAAPADQEIAKQTEALQSSLSALAESEMPGASDATQTVDQLPSGEKKNVLARIGEYAGETLNIIQKIQEMRAALRGASDGGQQTESSEGSGSSEGSDSSEADPTEEAPPSTEEATEEISGVVTEMGEPVAGVTVTEPESGATTETDSNGSYALPGVPAGRLAKLVVTKSGKQIATGQIDVAPGQAGIADFEVSPKPGGKSQQALRIIPSVARLKTSGGNVGVLKGVVKDAQGRPVKRALVRMGRALARSDSEGRYAFVNVPTGNHKLIVQRSGLKPRTEMVQVAAHQSSESKTQFGAADKIPKVRNQQTLVVRGTGTVLRGMVRDPQNHALPGAKITLLQQTSAVSVLSGPRGNYLLRDLKPGPYRVLVSKAGHKAIAQAVMLRPGAVEPRDFQLKKIDAPFIEKALAARRINSSLSVGEAGRTNKQVNRESPPRSKMNRVNEPYAIETRVGRLRGRVSDSTTGKPVSGATISILGRPRAKTDEEGNYSLSDAPAGSYQISIKRAGFAEQQRKVVVLAGTFTQQNFALVAENAHDNRSAARLPQLPAGGAETRRVPAERGEIRKGQLSGRVVDAKTGRPVPGAIVSVAGRRPITSDRNGSYAFDDLLPGAYRVVARKPEFLEGLASLVVRPGETTTTHLRLMPKPARVR